MICESWLKVNDSAVLSELSLPGYKDIKLSAIVNKLTGLVAGQHFYSAMV